MDKLIEKFTEMLQKSEYIRMHNIELLELSEDKALGRMPFEAKYCNPAGSMHGGCLYCLADTVAGTLAGVTGCDVATLEGSMNFLEPAINTEFIYCTAKVKRRGGRLVTCDVDITDDDGKLLDCGIYTFFKLASD